MYPGKELVAISDIYVLRQDYDPGNCSARFTRYYYSLTADACIKFQWSGCGGNNNRHSSEEACLEACTAAGPGEGEVTTSAEVTLANEVCALEAESGNCSASSTRYHFSPETGSCVAFTYSGCQVKCREYTDTQSKVDLSGK